MIARLIFGASINFKGQVDTKYLIEELNSRIIFLGDRLSPQ